MDLPNFHVVYPSWNRALADCDQQVALGGLLLQTQADIDQFAQVLVRFVLPDGSSHNLQAEVVQVLAGQGVAVQFSPDAADSISALKQLCSANQDDSDDPGSDPPQVYGPGEEPPARESTEPRATHQQVEEMTVNEKRRAALHGRKDVRLLLIRDRNKTIHPFVMKNPAITLDEVIQIAKMPSVNPDVLRMIAKNPDWVRSSTVCRNLVRNPKTPMREALAVLAKLPMSEVRSLAKTGNVRTAIQQAARKKVNS